jgi:hypothetical protein
MGKKRFTRHNSVKEQILDAVTISEKNNGQVFFEIEDHITQDIAEAVAIMMRKRNIDNSVWLKEMSFDVDFLDPRKCLYWLTGGDNEWIKLHNYNKPWVECDTYFTDEFEFVIRWIVKKSKNLQDIKNGFIEHLNLPVLYEFALSKNLIK